MNKTVKKIIISALLIILGGGISYYVSLPAINISSQDFWMFATWLLLLALLPFIIL